MDANEITEMKMSGKILNKIMRVVTIPNKKQLPNLGLRYEQYELERAEEYLKHQFYEI